MRPLPEVLRPLGGKALCLVLFVLLVLTYLPALSNGFVWDDLNTLVAGEHLRSWASVPLVFARPAMWSADLPTGALSTYRPLSLLSFIVDHQLYGQKAWGYHLTSVILHAFTQCLVFWFFYKLWNDPKKALVAALLGALHPASCEAVVWINGRSEVLALLFGMLAMICVTGRQSWGRTLLSSIFLLLALLGKESAILFVPLVVVIASGVSGASGVRDGEPVAPLPRISLRVLGSSLLAVVGYFCLRKMALSSGSAPSGELFLKALRYLPSAWFYTLQVALIPFDRAPISLGPWLRALSLSEELLYDGALLVLVVLLLYMLWKRRFLSFVGFVWFFGSLSFVAWLAVMDWPGLARWLYLGFPGLMLGAVGVSEDLGHPRLRLGIAGGVILLFFVQTQRTIPVWKNDVTLWSTAVEEEPKNAAAHRDLGAALIRFSACKQGVVHLQQALSLGMREEGIYGYLALCAAQQGACDEAASVGRAHPNPIVSPAVLSHALGACYKERGNLEKARGHFANCQKEVPACTEALRDLQ